MLGQNLKKFCESHGVEKTRAFFSEGLEKGKIAERQVSLRDLAEAFLGGHRWHENLQRWRAAPFRESVEGVDPSAFAAITGQLLINDIREGYNAAAFIGDNLFRTEPITNGNLGTQISPWLSDITSGPSVVQPLMPYPAAQFSPHYVTLPAPAKRGLVCYVSMEMIFSDLTGQARPAARTVGKRVRIDKEERQLSVIAGLTNPYSFNGTSYNTYLTTGLYINKATGVTLTDWSSIEAPWMLFTKMTDPTTGKPITFTPTDILAMPAKAWLWGRILNATATRSGDITTGAGNQTEAPSPIPSGINLYTSPYLYQQVVASGVSASDALGYFWIGSFKDAFVYREVKPLTTEELPPGNLLEFQADIAVAVKASEYGVAAVSEPRAVVLVTG